MDNENQGMRDVLVIIDDGDSKSKYLSLLTIPHDTEGTESAVKAAISEYMAAEDTNKTQFAVSAVYDIDRDASCIPCRDMLYLLDNSSVSCVSMVNGKPTGIVRLRGQHTHQLATVTKSLKRDLVERDLRIKELEDQVLRICREYPDAGTL
jgi:hypothetical protein